MEMVKGATLHRNEFEDSMWYETDDCRVNLVQVHLPGESQHFFVAMFAKNATMDDAPFVEHEMSLNEARLRYDFYAQLSEAGWFEKSA